MTKKLQNSRGNCMYTFTPILI